MSLILTVLPAVYQGYKDNGLDKNIDRPTKYGAYEHFKNDTTYIRPLISEADKSALESVVIDRAVNLPIYNYTAGNYALTAGRPTSLVIADQAKTSAIQNFTFSDFTFGIKMWWGEHQGNEIDYAKALAKELYRWDLAIATQLDVSCVAALEAARNQVDIPTFGGAVYNTTLDILNLLKTDEDDYYNILSSIMYDQNFNDELAWVGNSGLKYIDLGISQFSTYNQEDLEKQRKQIPERYFSSNIANASGKSATGYVMPRGQTAIVFQTGDEHRNQLSINNNMEWGTMPLPLSGAKLSVFIERNAGFPTSDITRYQAQVPGMYDNWTFWLRYGVKTAYNTAIATNVNPYMKFDIASS